MATQEQQKTANEFTNVKDIKGTVLYTKDNYILSYLRIFFYNIDLLSLVEKKSKTAILSSSFEGDRKDFAYVTYPREIDLDTYIGSLKKYYNEELNNLGRKHLLKEMILEASELASSGENYEHQHFIKLWRFAGTDKDEAESALNVRVEEFKSRYSSVGIHVEILKEHEIIKMCNLFGNALQAPYVTVGKNTIYDPITKLR